MGRKSLALEKRIATAIRELPDEALFVHRALTNDQRRVFENMRYSSALIAACWIARYTGRDDPLAEALSTRQIDPLTHGYIWAEVNLYSRLWELVQLAERPVRRCAAKLKVNYPFNAAIELFLEIVASSRNGVFSLYLQPYREVSLKKQAKMADLSIKLLENAVVPHEMNRLRGLNSSLYPIRHQWATFLFDVCEIESRKSSVIKNSFDDYKTAATRACELFQTATRKRESPTWTRWQSEVWKDGVRSLNAS